MMENLQVLEKNFGGPNSMWWRGLDAKKFVIKVKTQYKNKNILQIITISASNTNIRINPLQNNMYASKVHCGSAFEPGASGFPYYCRAPPVCVPDMCSGDFWKKTCLDAGKIEFCHCAAVLQMQVPKLGTDLDLGLL